MNIKGKSYFQQYQKCLNFDLETTFQNLSKIDNNNLSQYLTETSAVYSSNIEGNSMDLNSFMNTKLQKEKAKPKEFIEIQELIQAYDFAKESELNERNLLKVHKQLAQSFLIKSKTGKYREEKIGVFGSQGLIYLAVEAEKVKTEMQIFFKNISELLTQELEITEVFYFASMLHLKFAHIHPFADGNGRAARLLEKWFIASKIGTNAWLIQSEKYYKENIQNYYKNINLGVNYYELNYDKCLPFLGMLVEALKNNKKDSLRNLIS